jgi:pimeloyl-ACP methyl ester carboxylesterase
MPWPAYQHIDTCPGVKDSAKHLESLVNQVLAKEPDAKIVLVGFSLGGLVASYYVSQQPMAFVWKHIGRVVTIDSPLRGDPRLGNGCTTDRNGTKVPVGRVWADIDKNSEVVRAITGMGYERTMRFTNINSTNIGDFLDGAERVLLGCGSFDDFDPWSMFGLIPKSHDCAFWSEEGLRAISKAVNTPIPDFSRFPDMRVGECHKLVVSRPAYIS